MSRHVPLVCQHLENIHRAALADHQAVIRDFVRGKHGVYALYRGKRLRYVGLASDLSLRLKAHLADRHADSWDRFSVYLTLRGDHLRELESLVVRIFRPKDNRQVGKFAASEDLRDRFRRAMEEWHRQVIQRLFEGVTRDGVFAHPHLERRSTAPLSGLFVKSSTLRAKYKGRNLIATVATDGTIMYCRKSYRSPSGAAIAACGRESCDGWRFWRCQRTSGEWVTLRQRRQEMEHGSR